MVILNLNNSSRYAVSAKNGIKNNLIETRIAIFSSVTVLKTWKFNVATIKIKKEIIKLIKTKMANMGKIGL